MFLSELGLSFLFSLYLILIAKTTENPESFKQDIANYISELVGFSIDSLILHIQNERRRSVGNFIFKAISKQTRMKYSSSTEGIIAISFTSKVFLFKSRALI